MVSISIFGRNFTYGFVDRPLIVHEDDLGKGVFDYRAFWKAYWMRYFWSRVFMQFRKTCAWIKDSQSLLEIIAFLLEIVVQYQAKNISIRLLLC